MIESIFSLIFLIYYLNEYVNIKYEVDFCCLYVDYVDCPQKKKIYRWDKIVCIMFNKIILFKQVNS